jgi:hypothetical protein
MTSTESLIKGTWINEYGSIMNINTLENGIFHGQYRSTTGDTGTYKVVGVYDTNPAPNMLAVSFSISWRSIANEGDKSDFSHACSSLSGQILQNGTTLIMPVMHILTTPHDPANTWKNSLVDKLTYTKKQ